MQIQYYCIDCRHSWALDSMLNCKQKFITTTKADNPDFKKGIRYKNILEKLMKMEDEYNRIPTRLEGHCYCGCPFPENRESLQGQERLIAVRQRGGQRRGR